MECQDKAYWNATHIKITFQYTSRDMVYTRNEMKTTNDTKICLKPDIDRMVYGIPSMLVRYTYNCMRVCIHMLFLLPSPTFGWCSRTQCDGSGYDDGGGGKSNDSGNVVLTWGSFEQCVRAHIEISTFECFIQFSWDMTFRMVWRVVTTSIILFFLFWFLVAIFFVVSTRKTDFCCQTKQFVKFIQVISIDFRSKNHYNSITNIMWKIKLRLKHTQNTKFKKKFRNKMCKRQASKSE